MYTSTHLIAVACEYNGDHAPLRVIVDYFAEIYAAANLVSSAALRAKRTAVGVGLKQSTHNRPNWSSVTVHLA